jgi:hypothetical protein
MLVLDTTQCLRLLDVAKGRRLEALFVLAVTTGVREGELLALHWSDVDLSRRLVAVTGTLSRSRAGLEITDPKDGPSSPAGPPHHAGGYGTPEAPRGAGAGEAGCREPVGGERPGLLDDRGPAHGQGALASPALRPPAARRRSPAHALP